MSQGQGPGPRVPVILVTGPSPHAREATIAAGLQHSSPQELASGTGVEAVILEGLADAQSPLLPSPSLLISRIAAGCLCCAGNLVLRVTLNRLLRQRPSRIYLGVARSEHLDQLRSWLQSAPYDQLLELMPELDT